LEHLIEPLAAHFRTDPNDLRLEPIQHGRRQRHNVCCLHIGNRRYLLKQYDIKTAVVDSGYTPCRIETDVLSILYPNGCRVPQVVWSSAELHAVLLEWCGERTLDAVAQSDGKPNADVKPLLQTILQELCEIESCFARHAERFAPYIFHFDAHENLKSLLERGVKVIGYLSHLGEKPMSTAQADALVETWNTLAVRLQLAPTALGGLDNNARNIVIADEAPTFIDFASIGWNWQEMRLVQLLNSIGAFLSTRRENANFVSLLDRELVNTYAEWVCTHRENCSPTEIAARVDAHHLLFYLSAIDQLLQALAQPEASESEMLLDAWGNTRSRFQSALTHIIDADLSDDTDTAKIREMIAGFRD
jgi:hypothetical protein